MGFFRKLKFWKKRNNTTPTKVEACASTEDPQTCDAATVSTDLTVMCGAYTQTVTRMDGGGAAAAKQEYERELEVNNQTIGELEEELAVSKTFTSDLMLNVISVDQQVRKYAERPIIRWSDECECREQVSAVADFLKRFIITYRDAKKSKPGVRGAKKSKHKAGTPRNLSQTPHLAGPPKLTMKPKQNQTADRVIAPARMRRKM